MLSVHCPTHQREVLLGHRQILSIDGQGRDMTIRWQCWCGYQGRLHPGAIHHPSGDALAL